MNNTREKSILINLIIGDALATPLEGLSKAHIKATLKNITDYTDPSPAIKKRLELWKKPGLYSSITQLTLLFGISLTTKGDPINNFIRGLKESPENADNSLKIFRHSGRIEQNRIKFIKTSSENQDVPNYPCTRIIPIIAPVTLFSASEENFSLAIRLIQCFTNDLSTISGCLFFILLLQNFMTIRNPSYEKIMHEAVKAINALINWIDENSHKIFDLGLNPSSMSDSVGTYSKILNSLTAEKNKEKAEKIIYNAANMNLKTPVTRATVNLPEVIIPYALFLTAFYSDDEDSSLTKISMEGGNCSSLTSIAGALTGSIYGIEHTPEILIKNLLNRKKILSLVDSIANKKTSAAVLDDYLQSELSLTIKEHQEFASKTKKLKKTGSTEKKSRKEHEIELTRHVIESWTKADKARWKKERKKTNINKNI